MGGLVSVVREVPPKLLLRNTDRISDPLFDELLAASKANKVLIRAADRTCPPIQLGDATLRFLNRPQPTMPAQYASRDLNNASVVCRLEYGSVSFLFTGDLEQEGEEELLTAGVPLESDVLKVGHHGGKTATTKRFLDAVKPSVAIVSADYPPLRGAPNRGVLQRLYASGIQVLWTGRDGAITIETDGKNITRIVAGRGAKKKATSGCDQEVPREAGSTW
jgi:competence protein ComEC